MSLFTDSASRPGQNQGTGDDRALYLTQFGGLVINTYDEFMDYDNLHWVKTIQYGKSDTFPIIGRKRDAEEHIPGEELFGGKVLHGQIEITVDNMLVESVFLPDIDNLLNHIDVSGPYAHQIGQSLASVDARRIAITHILASRKYWSGGVATGVPQGQPAPSYSYNANMKTSASALEGAAWEGRQYLLENEISGYEAVLKLPHQQYLLVARNFGLLEAANIPQQRAESGSGSRVTGKVGQMVGFNIEGSNHIPKVNITTGNSKYQGDFSNTVGHISSKVAVGTLEVRGMNVAMIPRPERLGTLMVGSKLNGHGPLRPEAAYELAVVVRS